MKLVVAFLITMIPTILHSEQISVTNLDTGKVYVQPMMKPLSNECNRSTVEKYFGRKAINEVHAGIMCKRYKSAIAPKEPIYQAPKDTPAPVYSSELALGMSPHEVIMSSWGQPDNKTTTKTIYSTTEYWHYEKGLILIENNEVRSITVYEELLTI